MLKTLKVYSSILMYTQDSLSVYLMAAKVAGWKTATQVGARRETAMVLYGMVLYGMVYNGVVWSCMVYNGIVWLMGDVW